MKKLIVYFSLEGNTEYAAERMAGQLDADLLKLVPKKPYSKKGLAKFFHGGKSAIRGESPEIEPFDLNVADYELIIFGFPVWASNFAPPLRTFISDNWNDIYNSETKEKKFAAFACEGGSGAEKALLKLQKYVGTDAFLATAVLIEPKKKQSEETDGVIDSFCEAISGLEKYFD